MAILPGRTRTPGWLVPFKIQSQVRREFLKRYVERGSIASAATSMGLSPWTVKCWRDGINHRSGKPYDPEETRRFNEAWETANDLRIHELEKEAIRRAKDGSDVLLIFLLKGAHPQKYRDNSKVEYVGPGGVALPGNSPGVTFNLLSDPNQLAGILEVAKKFGLTDLLLGTKEVIKDAEAKVIDEPGTIGSGASSSQEADAEVDKVHQG